MPSLVSRGRSRRAINEINMVPFIDVMLVLLIIFMVTAPLIAPSVINLPSVGKAAKAPDLVIQIVIDKGGALELRSQGVHTPVSQDRLIAAVRKAQSGLPAGASAVVISAERSVRYEAVVQVMDKLQRAGVARVGLSVQLAK